MSLVGCCLLNLSDPLLLILIVRILLKYSAKKIFKVKTCVRALSSFNIHISIFNNSFIYYTFPAVLSPLSTSTLLSWYFYTVPQGTSSLFSIFMLRYHSSSTFLGTFSHSHILTTHTHHKIFIQNLNNPLTIYS